MTPLADILAAAVPTETGLVVTIPSDWMQGRTAYGGVSSALALHAAQLCEPDLPPLRSAQISFIGPLAGEATVTATKLRRGRTAAFIQSDVVCAAGLGLRATFVFMADQPSQIDYADGVTTDRTPPPADAKLYTGPDAFFTGNFNFLDIRDDSIGAAEFLRWTRLRARDGLAPMTELMAIADGLPPAAFKLFDKGVQAPVSSLTWIVNLLTPAPATTDGWWLLGARSGFAKNGCSSQVMNVWNADGQLMAQGMQSVAIFG
ncbi:MAG: thioesterase family protein [Sphingomonas sp.]